jgi:uncharacterized SAM-binding protein YcdF (DUF218 family)
MARRGERQRGLFWLNLFAMLAFLFGLWLIGLFRFAADIPEKVEDTKSVTDAIVVLTGGSGRLHEGLELLSGNLAKRMFVSGVYRGLDVRNLLHVARLDPAGLESRIGIGNAINTRENAAETDKWTRENAIRSIRLVTAAYHMPRSLLEFSYVMPDMKIIQNPVFPGHVKQDQWWMWPGTAALIVGEYNKFLMAWVRHRTEYLFGPGTPPGGS